MTYIPKPGERVRVVEVMREDPSPVHVVGDEETWAGSSFVSRGYPGWLLLADATGASTYCHVEPVAAEAPATVEVPTPMGPSRVPVSAVVRVRAYAVIADAVERACEAGVARAHKHTDAPDRDTIAAACADAVKQALCDVLDFGDET